MSSSFVFSCFLTTLIYYGYGQISEHCIDELPSITPTINLNVSDSNFSVATSASYHITTSTILIAGDFFYVDHVNNTRRKYYSYFKAFNHTKNNLFQMKFYSYSKFNQPSHQYYHKTYLYLRSWTRIIAHPTLPYFYLLGINNLSAFDVTNGKCLWTALIPPCSTKHSNKNRPLIYNDATFFYSEPDNIYVAGSCRNDLNTSIIVIDLYSIKSGLINKAFRLQYNLTDLGFSKEIDFGVIPPDVTITAPINLSYVTTSVVKKYFYIGFNHLMFTGIARIEQDMISEDYAIKLWPQHFSLINPSFMTHRSIVTTKNGLISLLDPHASNIVYGKSKHFIRWDTAKVFGQLNEKMIYDVNTWYGQHTEFNMHMDWTLSINPQSYTKIYVTSAPLDLITNHNATIAKHDVKSGAVIGGANVSFYALDTIITNDGQIISVGFELLNTSNISHKINISNISFHALEKHAVFQVFNDTPNTSTCIGCDAFYFGPKCQKQCNCTYGSCNDDLSGNGTCYCTLETYGETCEVCKCKKGICNSGRFGDGWCKVCLEVDLNADIPVGFSNFYGRNCSKNCSCNAINGICNSGENGTGHCLYCTNKNAFDIDCNQICSCNYATEYCDHGVDGKGCTKIPYNTTNQTWTTTFTTTNNSSSTNWFYQNIIAIIIPVTVFVVIVFVILGWYYSHKIKAKHIQRPNEMNESLIVN